jgi:hypothetical protein
MASCTSVPRSRIAAATWAVALLTSCASERGCIDAATDDPDCPDLLFRSQPYDELRVVTLRGTQQELGDATYPACNTAGTCADRGLGGNGATDVWKVHGVDPTHAVIGLREGTRTAVLFVAVGAGLPSGTP